MGIGAGVRKLTVESLKEALVSATTDQKQIDRARLIGKQIRSVSSHLCRVFKHCSNDFKEKGVEVAIEAIYRDLEYARSFIKRPSSTVEEVEQGPSVSEDPVSRPRCDSAGSHPGSEDWSVISDLERRSSFGSRRSDGKIDPSSSHKRNSLTAAMMSVLPDSFTSQNHRRCSSASYRRP